MPLQDLLPQIDDRRFDDLVTEIRTRIARYAPEWRPGESAWSDVNDNDPGVTLAQVFAWQAEMLLYRMNRVPALNYIKFLELIGITLQPAAPATAEVTLLVKATSTSALVPVPLRTQLSADPGDGGPTLLFETTRAITAWRARLDAVLVRGAGDPAYQSVTAANSAAVDGFLPFADPARDGAELALGFVDPFVPPEPLPVGTLDLAFVAKRDARSAGALACADTPAYPPASARWEYWNGSRWEALRLLKDETLAFTRTGHVYLKMPPGGIAAKVRLETDPAEPQRHWIRARLERSQYERAPALRAVRTNTVPVEQAETIRDEVLGGSDGSRNQRFTVGSRPVVAGSLRLEIEAKRRGLPTLAGGRGLLRVWAARQRLRSRSRQRCRPHRRRRQRQHPRRLRAQPGRQRRGARVPRGRRPARQRRSEPDSARWSPVSKVSTTPASATCLPASGGRDEETLDEVRKRAPRVVRSRERAVTAEDYEFFAMQAGNVKRAKALALFHPRFPGRPGARGSLRHHRPRLRRSRSGTE